MSCSKLAGTKTEANLKEAFAGGISGKKQSIPILLPQAKKDEL